MSFSIIFLECPAILQFPLDHASGGKNGGESTRRTRHLYIPGAGFSGFFFTLGRLHFLYNNTSNSHNEYYCFSAGCLALVATLMEVPLHDAVEMATKSRLRWLKGEIGRYDVVGDFVDELLDGESHNILDDTHDFARHSVCNSSVFEVEDAHVNANKDLPCDLTNGSNVFKWNQCHKIHRHLPDINIITSTWSKRHPMITQSIRTPLTVLELKQMLIQTTWIPFVTGPKLGKEDVFGVNHNDGAFVAMLDGWNSLFRTNWITDTITQYALKLPWDAELIWHGLNIVLDREKAEHFWKKGFMHDVLLHNNTELP